MAKIIVEQFNSASGCWNYLYTVDSEDFNPNEPYKINKYNGPYRTRIIDDKSTELEFITEGKIGFGIEDFNKQLDISGEIKTEEINEESDGFDPEEVDENTVEIIKSFQNSKTSTDFDNWDDGSGELNLDQEVENEK